MSVTGVVTTGIYCRGNCPGRPLPEHERHFSNAVSAQAAGFRPCLRCRPDRDVWPQSVADVPIEVRAAVQLIADGFLDGRPEDELAHHLGYSARQLRRLFLTHVGATPAALSRSRRAHFARRLIDESDLSAAQIASAAGFGSARQMRRVVKETFGFPLEALRMRRSRSVRLPIDGGLRLSIPHDAVFDFADALRQLSTRCIPGVEAVEGGLYRRVIADHDKFGVIEVKRLDDRHLELIAHLATWRLIIEDVSACRRLFGLDPDACEPERGRPPAGRRAVGNWDAFEAAVVALLDSGSGPEHQAAGLNLAGGLVRRLGVRVPEIEHLGVCYVFPSVEVLSNTPLPALMSCGLPKNLACRLLALVRAVRSREIDLTGRQDAHRFAGDLARVVGLPPAIADSVASAVVVA